jgi:hypothetical protein
MRQERPTQQACENARKNLINFCILTLGHFSAGGRQLLRGCSDGSRHRSEPQPSAFADALGVLLCHGFTRDSHERESAAHALISASAVSLSPNKRWDETEWTRIRTVVAATRQLRQPRHPVWPGGDFGISNSILVTTHIRVPARRSPECPSKTGGSLACRRLSHFRTAKPCH